MTWRRRIGSALGAVALGTLIVGSLPLALRQFDFFRLRRLELRGAQSHTTAEISQATGLGTDHNIFQPTEPIRLRLEALPGVVAASVTRHMPGTLSIMLEERQPIAFVPTAEGLIAVGAEAEPLPYDPVDTGLDLPVLERADSALARTLSRVLTADPGLYASIQGAKRGARKSVILELGGRQILWRDVPTMREIRAVEAVRRQLRNAGQPFQQLDARFSGAVIVRRSAA